MATGPTAIILAQTSRPIPRRLAYRPSILRCSSLEPRHAKMRASFTVRDDEGEVLSFAQFAELLLRVGLDDSHFVSVLETHDGVICGFVDWMFVSESAQSIKSQIVSEWYAVAWHFPRKPYGEARSVESHLSPVQ